MALLVHSWRVDPATQSGYCSALLATFDVEIFASLSVWGGYTVVKFERILQRHNDFREEAYQLLENTRLRLKNAADRIASNFLPVHPGLNQALLSQSIAAFIQKARDAQKNLLAIGVSAELLDKMRLAARLSGAAFSTTLLEWSEKLDH